MAACKGALESAQRGLLMRAIYGQIWTIYIHDDVDHQKAYKTLLSAIREVDGLIEPVKKDFGLIVAFGAALWGKCTGRHFEFSREVLGRDVKLKDTGGDALLYLKGPSPDRVDDMLQTIKPTLDTIAHVEVVKAGKRSDCRIIGGRYLDSISNPNDPVSLAEDILLDEGASRGGCFGFTQKFAFKWHSISTQTVDAQDEMVGRNSEQVLIGQHITQGHIHRAHIYEKGTRNQRKLLRQALPYGNFKGSKAREEGIMFVAFCNEQQRFEDILLKLLGNDNTPIDKLMDVVDGIGGNYWYVPSAAELEVSAVSGPKDVYEDEHWNVASPNGYMFYNSQNYLHQMGQGRYIGNDPPSPRIISLISRTFNHWRDGWLHRQRFPRLPRLDYPEEELIKIPVPIRKGMANRKTLSKLLSWTDSESPSHDSEMLKSYHKLIHDNGLLRIEPKELIVGVIPDFTLGRGKEVMPYLGKDETISAWLNGELNEWSAMGHVVPDYERLVTLGLGRLIGDISELLENVGDDKPKANFYQSALDSLDGVQGYLRNWASIAKKASERRGEGPDKDNMLDVENRLQRLTSEPPRSFQDAVQLIFSFHCCLHLVGELTSLGRLDQILMPFLERDNISTERAQEIIDCLWIKIGENAFVDRANIYDYVTYGTTSVNGVGGNFPQGGGINQWVQQITVGGYQALDDVTPRGGANAVTMLCLKAARRIPVNAPTLSLRVYKDMPDEYLDEAAKSILAGGAQPILYNDDKLCEGLYRSGQTVGKTVDRKWSRNYAADGCYEPMLAGASEFTFNNVAPMLALEQTINQGTTYGAAGPEQLRGLKQTFRSPAPAEIETFSDLTNIFLEQLKWLIIQSYSLMLNNHGALADVCPSPLLSTLIQGCLEKGRDHTAGGAKFHIIAPLCVGMSNTIDSLYAIKKLVYDDDTAIATLPQLVNCLIQDWGFNMQEPFQDHQTLGLADSAERALRFQEFRAKALSLPKWGGSSNAEVNELGEWLMAKTVEMCNDVIKKPHPALKKAMDVIRDKNGADFEFVVTPGIGTFEGYVGDGIPCGASADGRRSGMPIASDLSPVPGAQDLPAAPAFRNIYQAMHSVKNEPAEIGLSNASPVDMNIEELFPLDELRSFVRRYADGEVGGNLITLTCADLSTYQAASKDPEKYNLIRVRMGGWTEFYATMFQAHQDQHQRRQYFTHKDGTNGHIEANA